MAYRTRLKYTDEMKSYIWDKYQQGDPIWSIARFFDRPSSSAGLHSLGKNLVSK